MSESHASAKVEDPFWLTSLSSILAGATARLFCHPLDTIKAKIQVILIL